MDEVGRGKIRARCSTVSSGFYAPALLGHDLPRRYPPYQTCHRRFEQWQRSGLLTALLQKLAEDLRDRGKLDLSEAFIDASFSSAKKGALLSALLAPAKGAKSWRSATAMPRALLPRRNSRTVDRRSRLRDSDPLDAQICERFGAQLIAPHNPTRSRKATQDGRVLCRYRRHWKIERLFAWLHNFRRAVIRWEYYPENFLGMVQLACAVILLR